MSARFEIDAQPEDIRARLERYVGLITEHGLEKLPSNAAKHLWDDLWELRLKGADGIARALYVTRRDQRLIIVRVFSKKTQKTPPRELRLAQQRAKELV